MNRPTMMQWKTGENTGRTGREKELPLMPGLPMGHSKTQSSIKRQEYSTEQQYF